MYYIAYDCSLFRLTIKKIVCNKEELGLFQLLLKYMIDTAKSIRILRL
jgi:hypothetical protein